MLSSKLPTGYLELNPAMLFYLFPIQHQPRAPSGALTLLHFFGLPHVQAPYGSGAKKKSSGQESLVLVVSSSQRVEMRVEGRRGSQCVGHKPQQTQSNSI